jgi:hypothetical protein
MRGNDDGVPRHDGEQGFEIHSRDQNHDGRQQSTQTQRLQVTAGRRSWSGDRCAG